VEALRKACPAVKHWIEAGEPYEQLLAHGKGERPDIFSIDETAIAELFYTSGSTGTPKGVTLSHRTLYLHALSCLATFSQGIESVELHTIPLFHANGWGRAHSSTLNGLKQVMVRRFEPPAVLKLIEEEKATSMSLVPTMAAALLHCPELGKFDTSSMVEINLGGAAASPELIERLEQAFRCRVQGGYGLTESGPVASTAKTKNSVTYKNEAD